MDWTVFVRKSAQQKAVALFEEVGTGRPVDWDIVQDLCSKAFREGFKVGVSNFVTKESIDDEWVKYWKAQKALSGFQ